MLLWLPSHSNVLIFCSSGEMFKSEPPVGIWLGKQCYPSSPQKSDYQDVSPPTLCFYLVKLTKPNMQIKPSHCVNESFNCVSSWGTTYI